MKSWNFWTRVCGTLYGYRAYHPDDYLLVLQGANIRPRTIYAYGGKTIRNWHDRAEEHMWGGGRYNNPAQPWADTVLGWTPNGTVDDLIKAGGYFTIWQGRTVPLLLSWGEILIAIKLRRPVYNYQWNQGNPRRIPIYEAENQRELRDLARSALPGAAPARRRPPARSRSTPSLTHSLMLASPVARRVSNIPRWIGYYRRWITLLALASLAALLIPGMPGADLVSWVGSWITTHRSELIAVGVITVGLLIAFRRGRNPRRKTRSRPRTRRRRRR